MIASHNKIPPQFLTNNKRTPTLRDGSPLTHWGRAPHICVGNLTIIDSDNGLSPGRRQAIIWTNDEILLIRPLGKNFSEISIEILTLSFKKMRLKLSSAKWRPFCLGLNVLIAAAWFYFRGLGHSIYKIELGIENCWYHLINRCLIWQ